MSANRDIAAAFAMPALGLLAALLSAVVFLVTMGPKIVLHEHERSERREMIAPKVEPREQSSVAVAAKVDYAGPIWGP